MALPDETLRSKERSQALFCKPIRVLLPSDINRNTFFPNLQLVDPSSQPHEQVAVRRSN
jgi:hypothetical protein